MKETFTQPLLPQPRGVVPHAAGDQLAAEQGQPGVLHRLLLRLDEVQEEPQLREEEQRQSLQGWAKKVVHRLREFFRKWEATGGQSSPNLGTTFVPIPVQQQGGLLLLRRAQPAAAAPPGLGVQRLGGERQRRRQQ